MTSLTKRRNVMFRILKHKPCKTYTDQFNDFIRILPIITNINIVSKDLECDHETTAIRVQERKPVSSLLEIKEIILSWCYCFYGTV